MKTRDVEKEKKKGLTFVVVDLGSRFVPIDGGFRQRRVKERAWSW